MTRPHLRPRSRAWLAAVLLIAVAGCTSQADTDTPNAPSTTSAASAPSGVPAANQPFGDCPNLPDNGDGSLIDLSDTNWPDALSKIPALSQLSVTSALAGLSQDFNGMQEATVFAPTDTAFRNLGAARGRELLVDPAKGADVLRYHVLPVRVSPEALAGQHRTLNGQTLTITGSGQEYTINGDTKIVCGNLQTKNATLYLIDHVLQPS